MANTSSHSDDRSRSHADEARAKSSYSNSFISICMGVLIIVGAPVIGVLVGWQMHVHQPDETPADTERVTIASNVVEFMQYIRDEYAFDLEELPGVADRSLVPDDVPLPDEPVTERIELDEQLYMHQRLDMTTNQAQARITGGFSNNGWSLVAESELSSGHVQQWRKDERACQVQVTDWRHRSEQDIECWELSSAS